MRCWITTTRSTATVAGGPPTSPIRAATSSSSGPGTWRTICESWPGVSHPARIRTPETRRTGKRESGRAWVCVRNDWEKDRENVVGLGLADAARGLAEIVLLGWKLTA